MDYVLGIGPNAVFRYVTNIPFNVDFPRMLALGNKHCSLQLLTLCGLGLNLAEVITLVAELPLLTDLYCGTRGLGPSVKMQPLGEFAAVMNSQVLGSEKRLRCWHLDYWNACSDNEVAVCVLLLALACPKFNHVAPNTNDDDAFKREMEQIIELDWCMPYAPRLQRVTCCSDP
ncbi:hypothetical protein GGI24_002686 [Coemansia furcata]|nr:hypothetical protein GGI24_002686 [Coemansia furcata]